MGLRPHDLLRLTSSTAVQVADPPDWLAAALQCTPWVVVRRAEPLAGRIAVGVRGSSREQRCAAFLDAAAIAEIVRPEDLVPSASWHAAARREHPVIEALTQIAPVLTSTGLVWGVAGAAGFELATGQPVLTPVSDLDLILRVDFPLPLDALMAIGAGLARTDVVTDVVVETPVGSVALAELLGCSHSVLVKTADGPQLVKRATLSSRAA